MPMRRRPYGFCRSAAVPAFRQNAGLFSLAALEPRGLPLIRKPAASRGRNQENGKPHDKRERKDFRNMTNGTGDNHRADSVQLDRVLIFDTTLRDGEQSPGAAMTHEEKLEVAELLDQMGVDVIEAGFPIASEGDFHAVHEIAKRAQKAVVCGLSRAAPADIDRCAEAIKPARRSRIHTFISTSPVHMKWKLQMEP